MENEKKVLLEMNGGISESAEAMPATESVCVASKKNKKVLLGMSGGVDSSVSAILLKEQGYEVIGITMELFKDEEDSSSVVDAKRICDYLNIPHYTVNFNDRFSK